MGTTLRHPDVEIGNCKGQTVPLDVLLDPRAFRFPSLFEFRTPGVIGLLCDDRVIEAPVRALYPATEGAGFDLLPLTNHAAIAGVL